jgi:putative membrane protein
MIRPALLASVSLILAGCSGEGGQTSAPAAPVAVAVAASPMSNGAAFVTAVAQSDLYEVQSSRMARTRAADEEVKLYAQKMMDVHTQTTADMSRLIEGVEGARIPVRLDAKGEALLAELRPTSTADFQAAYLKQQVAAHREALAVLEGYAAGGDNEGLKTFASKTAKMVKAHLDEATKLAGGGAT